MLNAIRKQNVFGTRKQFNVANKILESKKVDEKYPQQSITTHDINPATINIQKGSNFWNYKKDLATQLEFIFENSEPIINYEELFVSQKGFRIKNYLNQESKKC